MKKLTIICVTVAGVIAIGCATLKDSTTNDNKVNQAKWQKEAPQLFNNAGYSKLLESNLTQNESNPQKYIGKVTNPFGIRDDVLTFILNYFPNNESAVYAAIRIEQYNVLIFNSVSDTEAVNYANGLAIPIWCLGNIIGNKASKYYDNLSAFSATSHEGRNMDAVIRKKLGWKVFGYGSKTNQELDGICDKGNY